MRFCSLATTGFLRGEAQMHLDGHGGMTDGPCWRPSCHLQWEPCGEGHVGAGAGSRGAEGTPRVKARGLRLRGARGQTGEGQLEGLGWVRLGG